MWGTPEFLPAFSGVLDVWVELSRPCLHSHCLAGKMLVHRGGGLAGARGACGLSEHGQAKAQTEFLSDLRAAMTWPEQTLPRNSDAQSTLINNLRRWK